MLATYFHSIFPGKDRLGNYLIEPQNKRINLLSILEKIRCSSSLKEKIGKLRTLDSFAYKKGKITLPAFSTCLFKDNIKTNSHFERCRIMLFDIDNLTPEKMEQTREKLIAAQWLYFCFTSPGGKGLKFAIIFDNEITTISLYKAMYKYLTECFKLLFSVELDKTSDPARACLFSFDEQLYLNKDAVPMPLAELQHKVESEHVKEKIRRVTIMQHIDKTAVLLYVQYFIRQMIKLNARFNYHSWYRFAYILATELGQSGRKAFLEYSLSNEQYRDIDTELSLNDDYDSFLKTCNGRIHAGSLFYIAKENGCDIIRLNEFLTWSNNNPDAGNNIPANIKQINSKEYDSQETNRKLSVSENISVQCAADVKNSTIEIYRKEQKSDILFFLTDDHMFTDEIATATGIFTADILAFNNALTRGDFGRELQLKALKRTIF